MKPKFFVTIFEVIGALVFGAAVLVIILFAEGYQYDSGSNDLIKKGVVYFKGLGNENVNPVVLLDGEKVKVSFPGELRVTPGPHDLKISANGYSPWTKRIIVPEEELLTFPQIRLFPVTLESEETMFLANMFEPIAKMKFQSSSEKGVLFTNDAMHYGKFYYLEPKKDFWVSEMTFKPDYSKLLAISDTEFFGLSAKKKLFFYNASSKLFTELDKKTKDGFTAVDLKRVENTVFTMDGRGKIFKVKVDDSVEAKPFFAIPEQTESFERIQHVNGMFLFLIKLKGNTVGLIADNGGNILFQEKGITGAYLDGEKLYYTKGSDLFSQNIAEKKLIAKYQMDSSVIWLSRIGKTFHFLFLTKELQLKYCDEDAKNCHNLIRLDSKFAEASDDGNVFFVFKNGWLTAFDFEEESFLPRFLKNLVSAVF
ncbi:hypothetical protein HZA42_01645 [Candidatus Peregrinibacteria bacterium]|nr:hypothetical protein [Candidatus Peregrinibacteria bacterium]